MTAPFRVRPARWEEADQVARLCNAINSLDGNVPEVPATAESIRRDLLGPQPWSALLVAARDDRLIGFVTGSRVHDSGRSAGCYMVVDLYVEPQSRRLGAGRALMAAMADLARSDGALALWWGVDDGDDEAKEFYHAIGARPEEHFTGYLLSREAFDHLAAERQA